MKFDDIHEVPFTAETAKDPTTCDKKWTSPPSYDDRCGDEAFARENPDLCKGYPRLVIKPGVLCAGVLRNIQLRTFIYSNGVELEVLKGLTYRSADHSIASVGAVTGNITGIREGITTISVTWQNLTAYAQVQVVADESTTNVGIMVMIDNSKSMQLKFDEFYASKLAYAKALARLLAIELNTTKDTIGVMSFNEAGWVRQTLTNNIVSAKTAINAIQASEEFTDIYDALLLARNYFETQSVDRAVIVLLSDGEVTEGEGDIIRLANEFRSAGGILFTVGIRAHNGGFDLLERIASGGFFLNGTTNTTGDTFSYLSGLKGYACIGNCAPQGNIVTPYPKLNYKSFINWNIVGTTDLIGDEILDLIPGNGLYVDLVGPGEKAQLTSKTAFKFTSGKTYKISLDLAGNQRVNKTGFTVRVKIGTILDKEVTIDDWKQGFTTYSWDVTPGATEDLQMIIQQKTIPTGVDDIGLLLNNVKIQNTTDSKLLLWDTFDAENPTFIAIRCGSSEVWEGYGTGYITGTGCYGVGCLSEPPIKQEPDPDPAPDIEVWKKEHRTRRQHVP